MSEEESHGRVKSLSVDAKPEASSIPSSDVEADKDIAFFAERIAKRPNPSIPAEKKAEESLLDTSEEGIRQLRGEYADALGINPRAFEGDRGRGSWVSPSEHQLIVFENGFGVGLVFLAKVLKRSSRTTFQAVRTHNQSIDKTGLCQVCLKCGKDYERETASKHVSLGSLREDPDYR
jgi:hypothetical protein